MASTISTGTVTSAVAMIVLTLFITESYTYLSTGVMLCLGRVYALTMLYNLNYRSSLNQGSTDINATHDLETSQTMKITNGIHVHRTASIHHESSATSAYPLAFKPEANDGVQINHSPMSVDLSDCLQDDSNSFSAQAKVHILPLGP
jgi:hypothetical protein